MDYESSQWLSQLGTIQKQMYVGLRKRFKYASITLISILFVAILAMGLWKNEEITELLCRLAFVIPMIKWLLLDTVKKLNKDISILQELDGDINNNEMKTMEDLQDIQKVIFQHRTRFSTFSYNQPPWLSFGAETNLFTK